MVVGMINPLATLTSEPQAWQDAELTVISTPFMQVTELASLLPTGAIGSLVDVRETGEMEKGTITGAINLPYRTIAGAENIPILEEPVAVFCNSGNRSSMAASLLERRGISVINIKGERPPGLTPGSHLFKRFPSHNPDLPLYEQEETNGILHHLTIMKGMQLPHLWQPIFLFPGLPVETEQ